jgi:hypothetical protein
MKKEKGKWYKVSFAIGHEDAAVVMGAITKIFSYVTDIKQSYWIDDLLVEEIKEVEEE